MVQGAGCGIMDDGGGVQGAKGYTIDYFFI